MKTTMLTFLAATSFAALTLNAGAQPDADAQTNASVKTDTNAATRRVVVSEMSTLKTTVEDIDYSKREVTLKGPKGNSMKLAVSDEVKNFPQIKKGDEVKIGYYESVAFSLAQPGETPSPTGRREALVRSAPGQKPGGVNVAVSDTTATVEDIDREKREVTLKGADGKVVTVKVDPSVGNLENIKKGDKLNISYTEGLAVSVETPSAQSDDTSTNAPPK